MASTSPTTLSPEEIENDLSQLFGKDVIVKESSTKLDFTSKTAVADYIDSDGKTRFYIAADFPISNSFGAALTMLAPATVDDAVSSGEMSEGVKENLFEVLNICTSLFASQMQNATLAIGAVSHQSETPDALKEIVDSEDRVEFEVEIPNYRAGNIAVFTCQ